VCTLTSGNR